MLDRHTIARLMSEYEFPWDITRALELALFRTYAVPSIGALLYRTGKFVDRAQLRYDDTTLLLAEIWRDGADSPRGRSAVARLNQIHGRYRISNDDFRYTLATFVVQPIRWLREFGWRPPSPAEVTAWTEAMRAMGDGMGITELPADFQQFSAYLDDYERRRFRYRPANAAVAAATIELMASWFPRLVRPLVRRGATALLDEPLLDALGLAHPPVALRRLARSSLRLRALLIRLGPPRPDGRPSVLRSRSYPAGYSLAALGTER